MECPEAIDKTRALANEEPKKVLPPFIPGFKASALDLPIPPKVEEAFNRSLVKELRWSNEGISALADVMGVRGLCSLTTSASLARLLHLGGGYASCYLVRPHQSVVPHTRLLHPAGLPWGFCGPECIHSAQLSSATDRVFNASTTLTYLLRSPMPAPIAKNPTWRHFQKTSPWSKFPAATGMSGHGIINYRQLDRAGRGTVRQVHNGDRAVPVQRIASVFCVSVETIQKALDNEAGDKVEDDISRTPDISRKTFATAYFPDLPSRLEGEFPPSCGANLYGQAPQARASAATPATHSATREDEHVATHSGEGKDDSADVHENPRGKQSRDKVVRANKKRSDAARRGRVRRALRDDAKRVYWPNPRASNFLTDTPISPPSPLGGRTTGSKLDRAGRGIARLLHRYDPEKYTFAHIGRIYSGVTHNVIARCVRNEYCIKDRVERDYIYADSDYYLHFPPGEGTDFLPPDAADSEATDAEDEFAHPAVESLQDSLSDEDADEEDMLAEDEALQDGGEASLADADARNPSVPSIDGGNRRDVVAPNEYEVQDEAAPRPAVGLAHLLVNDQDVDETEEGKREVMKQEVTARPPNVSYHHRDAVRRREPPVIYISDDEAPPAKRCKTLPGPSHLTPKTPPSLAGDRAQAPQRSPVHPKAAADIEGADTLVEFLARVPDFPLSKWCHLCKVKGMASRARLLALAALTPKERLSTLDLLFNGELDEYQMAMLIAGLARLLAETQ
ncbi:hypothetical protein C8R43DRAFT_952249 [Mycena crocata]|nr:hypothetical protein C8R43DRAFT_952249 [Mycena crocata]